MVPFELPFVTELALDHEDGKIKVSPAKKCKLGRLAGSKNKPKRDVAKVLQLGVTSGPKKHQKRKFGKKKGTMLFANLSPTN